MQTDKVRILVVDHNPLLREGLSALIQVQPDMELVLAAASGREAVRAFAEHRPAVAIMDLDLPFAEGVKATEDIIRINRSACVIGLVTYELDPVCGRALRAGARKCLAKDRLDRDLISLVRDCLRPPG